MHCGIASGFAHQQSDAYGDTEFFQDEVRLLAISEELGFDSIWITEHHFDNYSISPNPIQTLTYLAAKTRRVKLVTQVTVAPWHDPVRLAEQFIVLDHLSGGRAMAGFGRGLARREYDGLRIDRAKSRELFEEVIRLVMMGLETGVMEGGEIFKQPRVELRPRPLKSFKGRAFGAASTPDSQKQLAHLGIGRMYITLPSDQGSPAGGTTYDFFAEEWRKINGPSSNPPGPFISGLVVVDESADRARELAIKHGRVTFLAAVKHYEMDSENVGNQKGYEYYAQNLRMRSQEEVDKAAAQFNGGTLCGTPQMVLDEYWRIKEKMGAQGLFPHYYFGGMPQPEAYRNMLMFAKKCLPEIHSWKAESTVDQPMRAAAE